MFVVSPSTMMNAAALETRSVPKRMLGRIAILPRRGADALLWMRVLFEMQLLRYLLPLVPFALAMVIWPKLALPIAQAPVPMLLVIAAVEMKVLALSPQRRKVLITDAQAARVCDAFRFNAQRVLTQLAAARDISTGELVLVAEQSELARVPPLTLVSVQSAKPAPHLLDLSPQERDILHAGLFDGELTEKTLHDLSLARGENLHMVALDTASVPAHARMAAKLTQRTAEEVA